MSSTTTRRAVLAGAAALPAIAGASIALIAADASAATPPGGARPSSVDPIFATIDRYREAQTAIDAYRDTEEDISDEDHAAHIDAVADLLSTKPTTITGCIASLRFLQKIMRENLDDQLLCDWSEPIGPAGEVYLDRMADALEAAARSGGAA